jgi:Na+-driven multidrug efflux pump
MLMVVSTLIIGIGEGMPNPFTQPVIVQVGFLALALIIIGILAGWRWELSGGIISLFGWCLFLLPVIKHSPRGMNLFVIILALPGALYITSALLRRYYEKHPSA